MNDSIARLLVNLDDILDTRLGALFNINQKATEALLKSRYYAGRHQDLFPGFDMTRYNEVYENRDKSVLSCSTMTGVIVILIDFIQKVMNKNLNSPVVLIPEIHINMHPFVLNERDQALIIMALKTKVPLNPEIIFINLSLEQMNPLFLGNEYNTVVMYHFHKWLEIHSVNKLLEKYPCPNLTIFCPTLLAFKDDKIPTDLIDAFSKAMMMMQPFVNAIYIPVDNFCTFIANKPIGPDALLGIEPDTVMSDDDPISGPDVP